MKLKTFITTKVIYMLFNFVYTWDLTSLGIDNESIKVRYVTISYFRAFISIEPRNTSHRIPTVIEASWPENFLSIPPKFFPDHESYSSNFSDCSRILQGTWTELDDIGRLWVLDSGNFNCHPKIIIYDIYTSNKEVYRYSLKQLNGYEISSMKVDSARSAETQFNVFFVVERKIIWSLHFPSKLWRKLKFVNKDSGVEISIESMAFRSNSNIYLADSLGKLYRSKKPISLDQTVFKAERLGNLLGKPSFLTFDSIGYLYYYLPKYGTVARCSHPTMEKLLPENHEILMIHAVSVIKIFFGLQGSVFIGMEAIDSVGEHCHKILQHFSLKSEYSSFCHFLK